MREGTKIMIVIGILIAYYSITWMIYDLITKPIAEIMMSLFSLETEAPLTEGGTKLTVQLLLPIIIASFSYVIVRVISDIKKDIVGLQDD